MIKQILKTPYLLVAVILAAFIVVSLFVGGTSAYFAQGGMVKVLTGIAAVAFFLGLSRLIRFLHLSISDEMAVSAIKESPMAAVILSMGNLIASGLVTLAVF